VTAVSTCVNKIYNNYFNNTYNTYDDGKNTWNIAKTAATNIVGGPYLGGNYWCDYNGTDLDGDRLGDTVLPYNCSGGIENGGDYHPLITTRSNIVTIANNQVGEHYLWGAEGQIPRDGGEVIMAAPYVEQIVGRKTAHHTAQETTAGSHYCSGRHAHSEVTRLPHGDPDNQTHQANYRAYSWERFDWRCKDCVYGEACEGHRHFDCSGLVYFVYNQTGVPLVRNTAAGYAEMDTDIARADLKPGDVCYRGTKHIGIYVGGNQITHAAGHDKGVITTPLDASWNGFGCLLPPIVESTVPAKDAKCVPLNTNIVVNFDGKMDKASVESAFSISPSVSGTFTWSNTDKTLTFNPSSDLKKKTTYTVTIGTGAKDLGGNGIDGDADGREGPAYSWSFETVDTKNLDCGKDTMCLSQNKCSKFMMMDR
jgi:cell wall-associated NlpC family hydrolase